MTLLHDAALALRTLVKTPWFAVAAIASLSAGVAATSTIYSVTDALVAPARGARDHDRLVDIGRGNDGDGFDNMSYRAFDYLRTHATSFDGMAAVEFGGRPMGLTKDGVSERVFGNLVSGNFFEVLGTRPALGRFFLPEEDRVAGERPVVVLTHRFWTTRLSADPNVLTRPLRLNNREFTVVGVAEPGFDGVSLAGTDLWVPMAMVAEVRGLADAGLLRSARAVWHMGIGRLRPGVSLSQAQAELNALMSQYKAATPDADQRHTVSLLPTSRIPGPMRTPFMIFLGALFLLTGALLAVAASNVAGLLLARAAVRRREIATRLALGAGRGRLLTQLLTETTVLFALAGLVAIPLTVMLTRVLVASLPSLPVIVNLAPAVNLRVVLFSIGAALLAGLAFGLAPARHALSSDLVALLHGANATPDRRRMWTRHGLVVAQVALAFMLVVTAGLFVRSLQAAAAVDTGFRTADIMLANVDVSLAGFRDQAAATLVQRYQERVAAVPGVDAVAASRMIPLQGSGFGMGDIHVAGYASSRDDDVVDADWNVVSPEYFSVIDMRLVEGRPFDARDRADAPKVAIVNEAFARLAWPGRTAVGQRVIHGEGDEAQPVEVVGVAVDAKYRYVTDEPAPFIFVPLAQFPVTDVTLFVKHRADAAVAGPIRAAMREVEPNVPVLFVQSFDEAVGFGLTPQRLTAWIAGLVGTGGIVLAALGLYGLMAFVVAQRTREIAIRMAVGATGGQVERLMLGQAAWLGGLGCAIGAGLAVGVALLLRALLVGVTVVDPSTYVATCGLCLLALGLAAWMPTRRAATTNPSLALRAE